MINKKIVLTTGLLASVATMVLPTVVSCNEVKLSFWNYESYMGKSNIDGISDKVGYSQFGDLDEFEAAIDDQKVLAGISSDFQIPRLINENKIQKLDFKRLFNLTYTNSNDLKTKLSTIYSEVELRSLEVLSSANGNIPIWEYVLPYFFQEKVIAFDVNKGSWTPQQKLDLSSPSTISKIFSDTTYKGILNTLSQNGYQKLVINDYYRDNLAIGSEYNDPTKFTTEPINSNYIDQINGFKKTIEASDGFGQKISSSNIKFETSGTEVLESIIDPSLNWECAILYNGDSLDAYWSEDNFKSSTSDIRVVYPQNKLFMTDMVVIPSYITDKKYLDRAYDVIINNVIGNPDLVKTNEFSDLTTAQPISQNFDYVNYTVPYKKLNDIIMSDYFLDNKNVEDEMAKYIYDISSLTPAEIAALTKNNYLSTISKSLITEIMVKYRGMKSS